MEGLCCSALGCSQGRELYAVPPRTQVNNTLDTTPAKVQEQSQDVVTSKQGFVPHVPNFPSPRAPSSLLTPSLPGDLPCCHPAAYSPGCPQVPSC